MAYCVIKITLFLKTKWDLGWNNMVLHLYKFLSCLAWGKSWILMCVPAVNTVQMCRIRKRLALYGVQTQYKVLFWRCFRGFWIFSWVWYWDLRLYCVRQRSVAETKHREGGAKREGLPWLIVPEIMDLALLPLGLRWGSSLWWGGHGRGWFTTREQGTNRDRGRGVRTPVGPSRAWTQ